MASPWVQPTSHSPPTRKSGGGCLGPWLGWFSHGAMVPLRGGPSMGVFCAGLPENHCPAETGMGCTLARNPFNSNDTPHPPSRLCPGCSRGCAACRAAAFPAQTTHTHTEEKRVGVPRGPLPITVTPSLLICRLTNLLSMPRWSSPPPHSVTTHPPGCRGRGARGGARPVCDEPPGGSCGAASLADVRGGG